MSQNKPSKQANISPNLDNLRQRINQLDKQILVLLNQRAEYSLQIGKIKTDQQDSVFKPFREKDVLHALLQENPGPLPSDHLAAIYREILSSSRSLQGPQKVVYLGPEGTFSYFAGLHYLGKAADFFPCSNLEGVFKEIRNKDADLGIIPLENSLQGTVGQSLDLFLRYDVFIQAEIFCKISHSLLSAARDIKEIKTVYSHPQALQQCTGWLQAHLPGVSVIPVESTAVAAQKVQGKTEEAAIAHPALAEVFDLCVFQKGIEDLPENWTRFLIIGSEMPPPGNRDKTSLLFTLQDKPGSLAMVLNHLARENVNMKKLESRPLRGEKWQYVFFTDVECDLSKKEYADLMQKLNDTCHTLRILGSYPNGPYLDVSKT